jgi:type IV pilus assembly protein PilV
MVTIATRARLARARGASMIEVLVTIVILAVGLMGVAGLQGRLQVSELEGYQRAQAMILLDDMAYRFAANRNFAADYVTTAATPTGYGVVCPVAVATMEQKDMRDWCLALQGAGEKTGTTNVGTMIGGRGCVEALANNEYLITVAWQGTGPVSAPPASVACGANQYDGAGCTNDRCRRVVTTIVKIAPLI